MLVEEIKKQGKPYGLYFDQVSSGYTTTARRGLQAFTVVPLVVYRVYPDGRPDELIRGVDIVVRRWPASEKFSRPPTICRFSTDTAEPSRATSRSRRSRPLCW